MIDRRTGRAHARIAIRAGDRPRGAGLARPLGLLSAFAAAVPGLAAAGEVRLHEVTWAHQSPTDVSRFIVFVSSERGNPGGARQVEVGMPAGSSSGSFQFYSAILPIGPEEYVAIGAVGQNGVLGGLSGWSAVPPTRPGQPLVVEP